MQPTGKCHYKYQVYAMSVPKIKPTLSKPVIVYYIEVSHLMDSPYFYRKIEHLILIQEFDKYHKTSASSWK